ncbi:hypothetical protein EMIHUDRAFT_461177 [Emiliania huxleyi CCMP1516]|uniref:PDZ domain-containing protein n=2 Tax=Emiliania huxleyi TaxID=2903 RepID=A0A0D3JHE2_EMIH1|nr:hypothetical protein EMIHUDRAFT_461177 [Emiliania huxleyi CCMP1516]EOD22927.1 hypothetical protein EMIHUDRAFT_461177 [Emiliania huxleyi CCMP1516]|eukprot:XP_005775356.1 hypothetical protein EMIHUDRAFT_461177 [Emiliania huxleyi CCMP1516]
MRAALLSAFILAAAPSVAFRLNPSPLHSPHTPASLAVLEPRHAVVVPRHVRVLAQHSKGWDGFGKGPFKYYNNFDAFMSPFPAEDRETYPEMFALPKGVREVSLTKPLGIAFEEREPGRGVVVDYLVDGGNADESGQIQPGDWLILVTAIKVFGPRWERKILPAIDMPFDVVMGAIASNEPRYQVNQKKDVVLQFMRPAEADEATVRAFIEFFEIPYDHVFRTG